MQFLWDSESCQFTLEKILFCLCCDLGITGNIRSEELGCRQSMQSAGVQSFHWLERLKLCGCCGRFLHRSPVDMCVCSQDEITKVQVIQNC